MTLPALPLLILSFGNFAIGMGMMIAIGMMNEMVADLKIGLSAAGPLAAAAALSVALSAPLLAGMTTRFERRPLLTFALLLFAFGLLASAFAPGYASLFALRILTGFGAAIYTPQASATAALLVPPERRAQAIGFVFLGFPVALVFGVPLGAFLGGLFGWRFGMGMAGGVALCGALAVWFVTPRGLFVAPLDRAAWKRLARHGALLAALAVTLTQSVAQFILYSYLAPVFLVYGGLSPTGISLMLAWIGITGVAGSEIARRLLPRLGDARLVLLTLGLMLVVFLLWPLAKGSLPWLVTLASLWGLGAIACNMLQQGRLVALAPDLASASIAFNSSGMYLGQMLGAVIGAALIGAFGMDALNWAAGGGIVLAIGLSVWAGRLARQPAAARARSA